MVVLGLQWGWQRIFHPIIWNEVVDALIAMIDRPNMTDESLMKIIPAPDFPTGGEIVGTKGIEDAYLKGAGQYSNSSGFLLWRKSN